VQCLPYQFESEQRRCEEIVRLEGWTALFDTTLVRDFLYELTMGTQRSTSVSQRQAETTTHIDEPVVGWIAWSLMMKSQKIDGVTIFPKEQGLSLPNNEENSIRFSR
jgi:hypothetical protein